MCSSSNIAVFFLFFRCLECAPATGSRDYGFSQHETRAKVAPPTGTVQHATSLLSAVSRVRSLHGMLNFNPFGLCRSAYTYVSQHLLDTRYKYWNTDELSIYSTQHFTSRAWTTTAAGTSKTFCSENETHSWICLFIIVFNFFVVPGKLVLHTSVHLSVIIQWKLVELISTNNVTWIFCFLP